MPSKELLAVFAKYADPATQRLSYHGMVRLLDEHYAVDVAATFTAAAGTAAGAGSGGTGGEIATTSTHVPALASTPTAAATDAADPSRPVPALIVAV